MTNLTALIVITATTNWTPLGTFTWTAGGGTKYLVERGEVKTNITAVIEGPPRQEFVLKSEAPTVIERRYKESEAGIGYTNFYYSFNCVENSESSYMCWTNMVVTNYYLR